MSMQGTGGQGGAAGWQLAQINIGKLLAPEGDARVQPFFDALARINAIADASPGFVWRLQSESGNATDFDVASDPLLLLNMSVWESPQALFDFVYRSAHTPEMARRREYFHLFESAYQALWWVPAGHRPSIDEGLSRLWMLDRYGPTPQSFTFKARFPQPGEGAPPVDMKPDPWCIGTA